MKTRFLLIGVSVVAGLLAAGGGLKLAALLGDARAAQPSSVNLTDSSETKLQIAVPKAHARQTMLSLPLQFIPNTGQTDAGVDFTVRSLGGALFFTPNEVVFSLPGADEGQEHSIVRLRLLGANPDAAPEGEAQMAGVANFFLGNDLAKWRSNVPTYGAVAYRDVYPGIDLAFRGTEGQLKTEFLLAPGADPTLIQMAYTGVTDVHIRDDGALVLKTPGGELIDEAPVAYQEINSQRISVAVHFRLLTSDLQPPTIGFTLGDYDPAYPLAIDPVLVFSTYLGGSGGDGANAVAVDSVGSIYVAGDTASTDFPVVDAVSTTLGGAADVFVTKIVNNAGVYTYAYSTYLGGSMTDYGFGLAVDSSERVYVTGLTSSADFPTRNPISSTFSGVYDAFLTQLVSVSGVYTLGYSTYLGGSGDDFAYNVATDNTGNAYVTGYTASPDFPTWRAISNTFSGFRDAFVTQIISASGVITYGYSTYLGGGGYDLGLGIAVDGAGNAYVAGLTTSADFPTRNAISDTLSGPQDGYVVQIVSTSQVITYGLSTYLGGSQSDYTYGVTVDGAGNIYLQGGTASADFPTRNAIQNVYGGGAADLVVLQLVNASGVYTYGYSTYLGGSGLEEGYALALDAAGNVYVTGVTTSTDFPVWNPISSTFRGGLHEAFVTQIISTSGAITYGYSTYLGGSGDDRGVGIAVDSTGNTFVAGGTTSGDFPVTQNASSNTLSGAGDAFDAFVTLIAPVVTDLSVSNSDGQSSVMSGALITYTIVVTNSGPDAVSGVVVTDNFPAVLTGVTWSCEASIGSSCSASGGSGNISTTVNLSATGAITITASGTVASDATGTLSNTAYVAHPADFNTENNSATDSDAIVWKVYLPLIMK